MTLEEVQEYGQPKVLSAREMGEVSVIVSEV